MPVIAATQRPSRRHHPQEPARPVRLPRRVPLHLHRHLRHHPRRRLVRRRDLRHRHQPDQPGRGLPHRRRRHPPADQSRLPVRRRHHRPGRLRRLDPPHPAPPPSRPGHRRRLTTTPGKEPAHVIRHRPRHPAGLHHRPARPGRLPGPATPPSRSPGTAPRSYLAADSTDYGGCAQVDHFARQLGVTVTDDLADTGHYEAVRSFGPVGYRMIAISEPRHGPCTTPGCLLTARPSDLPDTWT